MKVYDKDKEYRCPNCKTIFSGQYMSKNIKTFGGCDVCYMCNGYEFNEIVAKIKEVKMRLKND